MKKKISAIVLMLLLILTMGILANAATVSMSQSSATIQVGDTVQLQALVDGTAQSASWGSSDTSVAAVSSTGLVTGKAAGSSTITAMVNGTSVDCVVSVVKRTTTENIRYNVLILDTSKSVKGTPLKREKEAAKRFIKAVLNSDGTNYLAVVTLNSSPKVVCDFTNNIDTLNKAINKLTASGKTNMNKAFQRAGALLDAQAGGSGVMKNIILCSDGLPQNGAQSSSGRYSSSDHSNYKYANAVYKTDVALKNKGYFVYALGFFHNSKGKSLQFGKQLMKDLASKDKYFIVTKPSDMDNVFNNIAADINDITISDSSITLYTGKTYTLQVKVDGQAVTASWKSSKSSVASVNASGKVTAKKKGTATITATVNGQKVTCKVTVKTSPASIKLSQNTATIYVGASVKLSASVTGASSKVTWSSGDKSIAVVKNGTVTGKKAGTVTIKAKANGKTATCKVTVKKPTISLDKTSATLYVGNSMKLTATVKGPSQKVTWKSKNTAIAAVNTNGEVTAVKEGKVKITATANGVSKTCTVTVKARPAGEIYTVADLKNMANNLSGTYYLMNDLDLASAAWTPIGTDSTPFTGKFYGNGHTISNLYINTDTADQGLFGVTSGAQIQRLKVTGSVVGGTYTGAIVGRMTNSSTISYCINYAPVSGSNQIGGIVGRTSSGSTIEYCLNYGEITSSGRGIGGITADVYPASGTITNCVNMANVSGGSLIGGIVGGSTHGAVSGCYNAGNVTGSSRKGAIAGDNASYAGSRTNNHFLKTDTINAGYSAIGTGSGTFDSLQDQGLLNAIAVIKAKF